MQTYQTDSTGKKVPVEANGKPSSLSMGALKIPLSTGTTSACYAMHYDHRVVPAYDGFESEVEMAPNMTITHIEYKRSQPKSHPDQPDDSIWLGLVFPVESVPLIPQKKPETYGTPATVPVPLPLRDYPAAPHMMQQQQEYQPDVPAFFDKTEKRTIGIWDYIMTFELPVAAQDP